MARVRGEPRLLSHAFSLVGFFVCHVSGDVGNHVAPNGTSSAALFDNRGGRCAAYISAHRGLWRLSDTIQGGSQDRWQFLQDGTPIPQSAPIGNRGVENARSYPPTSENRGHLSTKLQHGEEPEQK